MFYDRDAAMRTWEVRDVNVLLQELERFDGVCVLATNRNVALDKALERRITLKVEFGLPDRAMRRAIWERLIPRKMPLAPDVSLDELAGPELTGGEIKNAVLNAARLAVIRGPETKVGMRDFLEAIVAKREPLVTAADGRRTVELFTAIYRSQRNRRPVSFPLEVETGHGDFDGRLQKDRGR